MRKVFQRQGGVTFTLLLLSCKEIRVGIEGQMMPVIREQVIYNCSFFSLSLFMKRCRFCTYTTTTTFENDNDGQRHARVGMQQFDREPQYTEANPGEIVIMPCRVFNKKGQCVWQKDGKVCFSISFIRFFSQKVITFYF